MDNQQSLSLTLEVANDRPKRTQPDNAVTVKFYKKACKEDGAKAGVIICENYHRQDSVRFTNAL